MTTLTKKITLFSLVLLLTACVPYPYPFHHGGFYRDGGGYGGGHHHHHGGGHYRDGYEGRGWRH